VLNGSVLDVAIGMLLLSLVASLIASAVVEAVGGMLHRRQKHLWDTLDLLLGNTSVADDPSAKRIVDELYRQPFITGLVPPSDRVFFKPDEHATDPAGPGTDVASSRRAGSRLLRAVHVKTRATPDEMRRRRRGPVHIDAGEFASALLAVVRPGGHLDAAREALAALRATADASTGDLVVADLAQALDRVDEAGRALASLDVQAAVDDIRAAGATISAARLRRSVQRIESTFVRLASGALTRDEVLAAVGALPSDLQTKLTSVLMTAGDEVVEVRAAVEQWFDRNMTAASAWYRKQTRWFLFVAGIVMAASLNVDAVHAAVTLYRDDETRQAVVQLAEKVGEATCPAATTDTAGTDTATDTAGTDRVVTLDCLRDKVGDSISLPIGWGGDVDRSGGTWPLRIVGWLLIAGAVTMGAPFWFDLLGRALDLRRSRSTGA
jgi:hypothetical protein